jgi:hypothetical protein
MDSTTSASITVPVLAAQSIRLRPFRHEDADWVYYVSLDPELRRRLSLPDPYHRWHARYFVDRIALATARNGRGADFGVRTKIGVSGSSVSSSRRPASGHRR